MKTRETMALFCKVLVRIILILQLAGWSLGNRFGDQTASFENFFDIENLIYFEFVYKYKIHLGI